MSERVRYLEPARPARARARARPPRTAASPLARDRPAPCAVGTPEPTHTRHRSQRSDSAHCGKAAPRPVYTALRLYPYCALARQAPAQRRCTCTHGSARLCSRAITTPTEPTAASKRPSVKRCLADAAGRKEAGAGVGAWVGGAGWSWMLVRTRHMDMAGGLWGGVRLAVAHLGCNGVECGYSVGARRGTRELERPSPRSVARGRVSRLAQQQPHLVRVGVGVGVGVGVSWA